MREPAECAAGFIPGAVNIPLNELRERHGEFAERFGADPKLLVHCQVGLRGQLDAVIRMLEEGRECEDIITQLSAAAKAIDRAGYNIVSTGMKQCYREQGPDSIDEQKLEKMFLSLA